MADLVIKKEPDFEHMDERGCLTQLVHDGFEQINVLVSNQNVLRGGHYHKMRVEAFYVVCGSVIVDAQKDGQKMKYTFKGGDFFEISPLVVHSMFFPEYCIMVQMYDKCVQLPDGSKDIYTE